MRGLTGLPAVPQAPTAGPLHPSPDTHCSPPGLSYSFIQRLLTPLCLMAPTAPGTLDCPPVHSAFCQFSSSWNRSHVISYNFLALLERQLHESDYFVLSTVLFSSTENSTQHIVEIPQIFVNLMNVNNEGLSCVLPVSNAESE